MAPRDQLFLPAGPFFTLLPGVCGPRRTFFLAARARARPARAPRFEQILSGPAAAAAMAAAGPRHDAVAGASLRKELSAGSLLKHDEEQHQSWDPQRMQGAWAAWYTGTLSHGGSGGKREARALVRSAVRPGGRSPTDVAALLAVAVGLVGGGVEEVADIALVGELDLRTRRFEMNLNGYPTPARGP